MSDAFEWQIAKIVIVPKRFLVANFLKEIVRCSLSLPSRWRTFWYIELARKYAY